MYFDSRRWSSNLETRDLTNRAANFVLAFQDRVQRLKGIRRRGWINAGLSDSESVADHSFACAMLSMIVGDSCGLNTERLIRMALLHDLPESITGDLTPLQKRTLGPQFVARERRAANAALSSLPPRTKRKYLSLIDEYRKQRSAESRVVRDIDKIEMSIQALAYIDEGYPAKRMVQFLNSAEKDLKTDVGKALFKVLRSEKRF